MPIRKRLLGFAFASADLLVELSPDGRVAMALGSGPAAKVGPEAFQNHPFIDRLSPASARSLAATLAGLKSGARVGPIEILMDCGDGLVRRASFCIFVLPELAPNASCSIRYEGPAFRMSAADSPAILTPTAFLARARSVLEHPYPGDNLAVSFVDISGLPGDSTGEAIVARLEATMQSASVGGASAARLTADRYVILRDLNDARDISGEIREVGHADGLELIVTAAEATLSGPAPLSALRALRYAVEGCLREGGLNNPELALNTVLARTLQEAEAFRVMVRDRAFALHYQPIVDLKSGAVHHFEALARFSGDNSPAAAIHMAEELALIESFDLAVAEKALTRLRKPGSGLMRIAINVSGVSVSGDSYVQQLLRMTAGTPEERKRLIVEVTESSALGDLDAANRRLTALREAGIKVCIDDFGAGSASFDYLRGISVDTVKFDARFVRDLETDPKARTVLAHLVQLCGSMKLATIAEMVETDAVADILRSLGVDYAQGWLFGRAEMEPRTVLQSGTPVRRRGAVEAWG